jgi:type IV pilus assembly protein PilM
MSTEIHLGYDPYKVWLNIQDVKRPLNPYQLLCLKVLEKDQARIRTAISRQRSLMEARKPEADPDVWEKINQELEDAISQLQDPDQKMLLDAVLKRQQPATSKRPGEGAKPEKTAAGHEVICRDCNTANPSNRRFCTNCGTSLFDVCPVCATEVTATEKFCGACGTNLHETLRKQEAEFEDKMKYARQLQHDHKFEQANTILKVIAVTEDARFERYARKSISLLERFAEERKQYEDRAGQKLEKAKKYMEKYAYEKAMAVLLEVPETLRAPELKHLLEEARAKRNELLQLGGEIREAMEQNRKHDLLPKIERMLGLKPDHSQARELAEQLRDNICSAAKKKLLSHSYDEARIMLETIPTFVRNEEVEKLFDRAIELDGIATDVRLSPVLDETVQNLLERLGKLSPNDESIKKQLNDLQKKKNNKPTDPWAWLPAWSTTPRRTLLGMPVDYLGPLKQCHFETPDLEAEAKTNPMQYHVALGLALQAIEQADVPIDMLPTTTTFMSNMMAMMAAKPKNGWGLDLSPAGLKVVKLAMELKDGKAHVLMIDFLPHSKVLSQASDDIERAEIILETLKQAKIKYQLPGEKDKVKDRVVAAMASRWTLGRFFDLPPVAKNKLQDAVTFEAKHQIPIPLNELNWGFHAIREGGAKPDFTKPPHVVLVAAKDFHLKERSQHFKAADIVVSAISADPVALHNAMSFEFLRQSEEMADDEYVGFMDIGTEGSTFVISSKKDVWFRTTGNAGNDLTTSLVKRFQLTYQQADELKKNPSKARRYNLYWEAMHPLFVQFSSEIERSVGSFVKQFPGRSVKKMYLVGGGCLIHGLLRYLIHGR